MGLFVLCGLAFYVGVVLSGPVAEPLPQRTVDKNLATRQHDVMLLYFHIYEPNHIEKCQQITKAWRLEKNIVHFTNVTAVKTLIEMLEYQWLLPRGVPFSIHESVHRREAITIFNVLFSAENYDTFYKAAVYLRDRFNEDLFSYTLSVAILNRPDTQGISIPAIYEYLPSFFNNGEVMTTAQRINVHEEHMIEHYPSTYKRDDVFVIRVNDTVWPYYNGENTRLSYFTEDYGLNAFYFNFNIIQPFWLGGDVVPLIKDNRGEYFWFVHKQIVARYYLERLSNGLGEIPKLGHNIIKDGYNSGLLYQNGISYPVRPNYFDLNQPEFVDELQAVFDYERRVRDAIHQGYVIDSTGNCTNLRTPEAIDILGRVIESNVDSPNPQYYKDIISIWKKLLGNSIVHEHDYVNNPLVVPSALENYQTALRDPAFYMIWKRILGLFESWQEDLPQYKREELALNSVAIEKVEVDVLKTYFEYTYMNLSAALYMNEEERKMVYDQVRVLAQYPRLNHRDFQVRINVKSEIAQKVVVKFFLAPKYDSQGYEIPVHIQSQNAIMLDWFIQDLLEGESVIVRNSSENSFGVKDRSIAEIIYQKSIKTMEGLEMYVIDQSESIEKMPIRLLLPKGRIGGMPFVLIVYISEYRAPKVHYGTGFDPALSLGIGSGARRLTADPLGFPFNRPVHQWQVKDLRNIMYRDVLIYHEHAQDIDILYT